jgi:MOSC domain-containing protein YiiM
MGENITTRGLPILDLTLGARLHIGDSAVIEITGLRNPCNQLDKVDARLLQQVAQKLDDGSILRKAGIMGVVLEGGVVRAGDAIRVEVAAGAGARLEPV